ncbi:hypothetical protein P7C70_g46, partial [Phenoliferia sp. Uapishka_3]
MLFTSFGLATFATSALALAVQPAIKDAPFSVSNKTMEAAITCPFGIHGKKGGIVLLVHGTGSTGPQSWDSGPYTRLLPAMGKGYDVCYITLPGFSTGDVQFSSQYVAHGVQFLAPKSATRRVAIIGHSQGAGVNPQHALTYWPSIVPMVSNYIALAADFHGTVLFSYSSYQLNGATAASWQQAAGSNYLASQNFNASGSGASARAPTTSIYTYEDDIVQPELVQTTSYLPGAGNHAIQDLDVCGPSAVSEHFTLIVSPQAFGLAFAALEHGSPVDLSKFDKTYCTYTKGNRLFNATDDAGFAMAVVNDGLQNGDGTTLKTEPTLQPWSQGNKWVSVDLEGTLLRRDLPGAITTSMPFFLPASKLTDGPSHPFASKLRCKAFRSTDFFREVRFGSRKDVVPLPADSPEREDSRLVSKRWEILLSDGGINHFFYELMGKLANEARQGENAGTKAFGVRRLELRDFGRLSVRALESKGLNRLSSLHILTTFPDKPATILALSLPFQLTSLFLYNSPYPPELIQKLFECSSRTLKTLSLSLLQSSPAYPALISNLHHIAPTLQSLSLNHRPSQPLIEALHLCTQLQHLTCNASVDLGAVLDSIQCPLLTLNIQLDYGLEQTLKILLGRMGRGSLASLKRMGVKVLIWGTESRLEDLRKECEKEKVDLYVETRTEGVEEALRLGLTTDLWHD